MAVRSCEPAATPARRGERAARLALAAALALLVACAAAPPTEYIVQEGDTLPRIADATGVPVEQLLTLNALGHPPQLETGRRLRLAAERPAAPRTRTDPALTALDALRDRAGAAAARLVEGRTPPQVALLVGSAAVALGGSAYAGLALVWLLRRIGSAAARAVRRTVHRSRGAPLPSQSVPPYQRTLAPEPTPRAERSIAKPPHARRLLRSPLHLRVRGTAASARARIRPPTHHARVLARHGWRCAQGTSRRTHALVRAGATRSNLLRARLLTTCRSLRASAATRRARADMRRRLATQQHAVLLRLGLHAEAVATLERWLAECERERWDRERALCLQALADLRRPNRQ
jgi:LysM repeat protein